MLSIPTPFPQQGSNALLGLDPVRIIQRNADGSVLITRQISPNVRRTATVALDELADAAMPDHPIDRWIEERVMPDDGSTTAAVDLHRDLDGWCRDRGYDTRSIPGAHALHAALTERGFRRALRARALHFAAILRARDDA